MRTPEPSVPSVNGRPAAYELRVHGVGGSHGSRMLGYESPTDVVVVGEGVGGTAVLARRSGGGVESYDWGDLTSGSGTRSLWIILLPFTLLNLAGWMHPPVTRTSKPRVRTIRAVVHVLSILLTATYVFSLAVVAVDVVGWQWSRRYAFPRGSALTWQRWGVVISLVVLLVLALLVMRLGAKSQVRFEGKKPTRGVRGDLTGDEPWDDEERLCHRGFFFHVRAAKRRLLMHQVVLLLTWLVVVGWSLGRAFLDDSPPVRLDIGRLLGPSSTVAVVLILVLYGLSWDTGRQKGELWVRCGPAIASTLAFALTNAIFSGAILLAIDRLNKWPERDQGAPLIKAGAEVNLVDAWGVMILLLGLVALGALARSRTVGPAPVEPRRSGPGRALDGADESYARRIASARFMADLAHRGGVVALGVAVALIVAAIAVVTFRVVFRNPGSVYLEALEKTEGPFYWLGTYLLLGLVLLLIGMVRTSVGGARTLASTLWDVLTFWPRRFSPLAVRPYSERAVPELQGRIVHRVGDEDHGLVVSAHSQGSILAFAAMAPLDAEDLRKVGFVTYGSPITSIFATFFPAYFGTDEVRALRGKLSTPGGGLSGWRNFYRRTDPIGGPVFPEVDKRQDEDDCTLDDPFEGPVPSADGGDPDAPLERDRPLWSQLAGHSHYQEEPVLKQWVRRLRVALGPGGP